MFGLGKFLRLAHINLVLYRHGLDELILATHFLRPVRFLYFLAPWNWFRRHDEPRGVRIRRTLEDLGPIFVKFGQILSTRRDLLPRDIADELARLQDAVPPFPGDIARRQIEKALEQPITQLFAEFDETPLASASIAQVHPATLPDGRRVVVKVLRPNIEGVIRGDLEVLRYLARLAERYWADGRRLRPIEVVDEYEHTILDELDLMREAASASQLRRNFEGSALLYVPRVEWPLSRRGVMVMERISGLPISDIDALRAAGVDLQRLAENGVEIFFTQVFRHNFFHADMHPGNIFVAEDGRYLAVDFGIMGTLSHEDQRYLAENFLAFFNRDYRRVAVLHVESGWVPAGTRVDEFESAIRSVCEPIFERPLKDISFGHLLLRLFQTARRFDMPIQPQLVLLQKTLLNVEGLGRQLYPDLDLWKTAKPFLERWMSDQIGWRGLAGALRDNLPQWAEQLPEIPGMLHDTLRQARTGKLKINWTSKELEGLRRDVRRASQRSFLAIVGGALIISAAVLLGLDGYSPLMMDRVPVFREIFGPLADAPLMTWILGGMGLLALLSAWPRDRD